MFIGPDVKERLSDKLLKTVVYQEDQESKKKALAAGFNNEINKAKARVSALTRALKSGDLMELDQIFDPEEIKFFEIGLKPRATLRPPE